ncbi:MAG: MopE-related protein [Desulfobulbaceae bacterium]
MDCNDTNAAIRPGATENCTDNIDNNCNGLIDDLDPAALGCQTCTDNDKDGYSVSGGTCGPVDCNDANAAVRPGATENCTDNIDNNCNGLIDDLDPAAVGCQTCTDNDKDGYWVGGPTCTPVDCDDTNVFVRPSATENCTDGIDNNCNGLIDAQDPTAKGCPTTCTDNDGDGYSVGGGTCGQVDCNDANAAVSPAATENCTDGIDNNCNGLIDAQDPAAVGCPASAPNINLSPATLIFGSALIGDSLARNTVIQNLGTADLVVDSISPAGGTSTEFSITAPGTPFAIPAGGSRTVTVTYQPVDGGTDNGGLVISSDDPDEPTVSLSLSGTGDAVPTPDIHINLTTLNFNKVVIGQESQQTLTIQNLGTAPVTINTMSNCAETSTEFNWLPDAPFTLPAKTSMTLSVIYAPLDDGTDKGCLSISSNDPDESTVEVALQAVGVFYKSSVFRFLPSILNAAGQQNR